MIRIDQKFAKPARPERIIQFGEGGFLRGFADWMLQKLNDSDRFCGSAVVVQPIAHGMCETLSAQDCRYTHIIRGTEGVETTVIDVISRCVNPYEDYESYLALADNPDFRFIVSNTTEIGIAYHEGDSISDQPPVSFPAKLTALMHRRFLNGMEGFILLPCELIERNGDRLRELVLRYAQEWNLGDDFVRWVCEQNHFCTTLVDRIVTGYPKNEDLSLDYEDKMVNTSEYFHLWVIEGDRSLSAELPLHELGLNVLWTDNLEPYRTRKVRILNGAHTSLVPYALLSGLDTVKSCMEDATMREHVRKCVYEEIVPTLDLPRDELVRYADSVLTRFENPYIRHYLADISLNSVGKFRVRVLPSILEYIRRFQTMPEALLFSFGKLIEFYRTDRTRDDAETAAFMKTATLSEILGNVDLWGTDLSFLRKEMEKYVDPSAR